MVVGLAPQRYTGAQEAWQAFGQGLDIGARAVANASATTLRTIATLGIVDSPWEVMSVDHLKGADRALYDTSFGYARVGTSILASLAPGAMATSCGWRANVARGLTYLEMGGNVVNVGRGIYEGDPLKVLMGGLGIAGNMATLRQLNGLPCFTAEMQVIAKEGWVRWDKLKKDDELAACDELDPFGKIEWKRVEEVFTSTGFIWHVHVSGEVIRTTGVHPFYVWGKGWVAAQYLKPGDKMRSHDGRTVEVEEVVDTGVQETVYNCRVADYHTYFVGSAEWRFSVWAHNAYLVGENEIGEMARFTKGGFGFRRLSSLKPEGHHIATIYGDVGKQLKAIFKSVGVSMESAWNKTRVASHLGPHGEIYNRYVLNTLRDALANLSGTARQNAFFDAMYQLRREIITGDLSALLKVATRA